MKTTFMKFMIKGFINLVCGVLSFILCFAQKNTSWLLFTLLFIVLFCLNIKLAWKHKDDTTVVDVVADKYRELKKETKESKKGTKKSKREMKQMYKARLQSIEDEFEFDYDDEEELENDE